MQRIYKSCHFANSLLVFLFLFFSSLLSAEYYNVKAFGAAGNGVTYDTKAVQAAIDSLHMQGGGTLYFPAGSYLIKTIVLKSNITLFIGNGAVLLGSTEMGHDKPLQGIFEDSGGQKFGAALIVASGAENIAVEGKGIINGQGYEKFYPKEEGVSRPSLIRLINCRNVKIQDIKMINSAAWVQHYIACEDLIIRDITVNSYSNKNNDGLDIESCERVLITGCNINSEDDSIVLKTLTTKACRDVVISDCIISGLKSALKTGTESIGNFENITISNCTIYGTRGINLLAVDGGNINNVTISNISMRDSYAVIVMRLGERMRPYNVDEAMRPRSAGTFQNIMISNIQAVGVMESNDFISGIPGHYIENVSLSNVRIEYIGGGKKSDSEQNIPELADEYPKAKMFVTLPAYGFFIRHAKKIKLRDLSFSFKENDQRSVIKCEDVSDFEIKDLTAASTAYSAPLMWLVNSSEVTISGCNPEPLTGTFLKADNSRKIHLLQNRMSLAKEKYELLNTKQVEIFEQSNF
jgi:polygalacturonase